MQKVVNAVTAWLMLAAILIVWNSATRAEVLLVEDAIEVYTNTVYWSGLRAGRLVVRTCPECSPRSLRADEATRYSIRGVGEFLEPGPFLDEVDNAEIRNGVGAIYLARGTDRISRIVLLPAQRN